MTESMRTQNTVQVNQGSRGPVLRSAQLTFYTNMYGC